MPNTVTGPIRQQIGPLKGKVAQHIKSATTLVTTSSPTDVDALRALVAKLQLQSENLKSATKRLQDKNDEWANMVKDIEDEQQFYEASCTEIMDLISDSDEMCNSLRAARTSAVEEIQRLTATPPASSTPAPPPHASTPRHAQAFKAPKIRLPTFSGDYMEFKQFWGIFEANIHLRDDLSNIEKFTYLLSQVEGDAKQALAGVLVNDENYDVAVALLKSRFDRADDRIITMLYSDFMRLPGSNRSISSKQKTLDSCERIFRQLECAGEDVNSNKSLTVSLLSKFPAVMVKDLQRYYHVGANSTLNEVRDGLQKSIAEEEATSGMIDDLQAMKGNKDDHQSLRTAENVGSSCVRTNQQSHRQPNDPQSQVFYNSALPAMTTHARPNQQQRGPRGAQLLAPPCRCYFCEGEHFNGDCPEYPSAESRRRRLPQVKRCPRCLKRHRPYERTCPVLIKCIHCRTDGDHASALCNVRFPDRTVSHDTAAAATHTQTAINRSQVNDDTSGNQLMSANVGGITALNHADCKPALFQTAKTVVFNPETGQQCVVRLAMDTLSSKNYITDALAHKLGLMDERSEKLYVSVFGTEKTLQVPTTCVSLQVALRDGSQMEIEANTTKVICKSSVFPTSWSDQERQTLAHFQGSLADDPFDLNGNIDVLIGASLVWQFIDGARMPSPSPGLFFVPSKFGLMLCGEAQTWVDNDEPTLLCLTESPCRYPTEIGLVACESQLERCYPDVDEFWDLEKIGISDDPTENEDDRALDFYQKSVTYEDGRYQVALPWIDEKRDLLPSNYYVAYDRLRSLAKRLRLHPELLVGYRDVIQTQLSRDIIEEVPVDDLVNEKNLTHYLPHHAVVKPTSTTTKVRIVFDASAKKTRQSLSLNECLMRGPVILPDLCQLLIRMRTHDTIVLSDIEKAFLQVALQPADRDVTRFLWFKDDTKLELKDNVRAFRFKRVNFGVISSPFLLAATINHHLTVEKTAFAESLRDNIYVDNVVSGLKAGDDPIAYYKELKELFHRAGMNITEFCSNSKVLMNRIPKEDQSLQTDVRVLGLKWDSVRDTLRLAAPTKLNCSRVNPTKRSVLQAIASVFDPLGLFQPILLPAKCLLQRLWELKYGWDDPVANEVKDEWANMQAALSQLQNHRVDRFVGTTDCECSVAIFCDASAKAYATAVYLRCNDPTKGWSSHLVFAKSRLSPTSAKRKRTGSRVTLPCLELLGAVIGVRAGTFVRNGLKIPHAKMDIFIDSQCVLHWIRSRGLLKRFVANRVEEIRKATNCEFHYVSTSENPADFGTRGKLPDELFTSRLWWNGPSWLSTDTSTWPSPALPRMDDQTFQQMQAELKPAYIVHSLAAVTAERPHVDFLTISPVNVSSLNRLVRVSTICLKFLKRCIWQRLSDARQSAKPGLDDMFKSISDEDSITADDHRSVKRLWTKTIQRNHFGEVLDHLERPDLHRAPAIVSQLGLKLDSEGFIRTYGRFEHANLGESAKYPLLLPKDDRFTTLVVEDVHRRVMHSGISHTLSQVRLEYWIPHGRALVRTILSKCIVCRHYKSGRPYKLPPMPPLPSSRVLETRPFETTGLDYFGPVTVTVNGQKAKMWVCLYTCLTVRAVHLEPVMDFSAQEFLHCLMRFIARRGAPKRIISDNAAQFRLAKILGDKAWKRTPPNETISAFAASSSIEWKFITELAPWQGGFYERLVGLVKSTLKTSIRRKLLTWTDFVTLLAEAESVVNSRPMTYACDDVDSTFRTIRPNDFLQPLSSSLVSAPADQVRAAGFGDAGKRLVAVWKQRTRTLEKLWEHWRSDYLLSLRERSVVPHRANRSDVDKVPFVGQVVLICDSDTPRGQWRLARITKLPQSSDGSVRSAELRLPNGSQLRRPLNLLVPLEVEHCDVRSDDDNSATITPTTSDGPTAQAPPTIARQTTDDDDVFMGFSSEDITRAIENLRRFDDDMNFSASA